MHPASSGIVIVTPALADANNGNWRTAERWASMLARSWPVRITKQWRADDPGAAGDALMIALHARRSAASVAAWRAARGDAPLALVLTGTDLYRDIEADADAQRSLALADRLVVLNELGAARLPERHRARCVVILQSAPGLKPAASKPRRFLRVLMVGHLRPEKDPATAWRAIGRLAARADLRFDHIGGALDAALGREAQALMARCPGYRWLGERPHAEVRRRIRDAHVLVHPSIMEGGAQVVIEAIRSGTPVFASRVDGNVGLLGEGYGGCFEPGDDAALAALVQRARDEPAMLAALARQAAQRSPLFDPAAEAAALHRLVHGLLVGADGPAFQPAPAVLAASRAPNTSNASNAPDGDAP